MRFIRIDDFFESSAYEINDYTKGSCPKGALTTKKTVGNSASSKANTCVFA
jgi:hypothetical protein